MNMSILEFLLNDISEPTCLIVEELMDIEIPDQVQLTDNGLICATPMEPMYEDECILIHTNFEYKSQLFLHEFEEAINQTPCENEEDDAELFLYLEVRYHHQITRLVREFLTDLNRIIAKSAKNRNDALICQLAANFDYIDRSNWSAELIDAVHTHRYRKLQRENVYFEIERDMTADTNAVRFDASRRKENFERIFPDYKPPSGYIIGFYEKR